MKASERLRELAEERPRGPAWVESYVEQVSAFLPFIADCIKAAEELPEFFQTSDGRTHSFVPLLDALGDALGEDR